MALLSPRVVLALLVRPDLWIQAMRSAASLAPKGWWRTSPFLPIPDSEWMRFRLETAYGGDGTGPVNPKDMVTFLEWQKAL